MAMLLSLTFFLRLWGAAHKLSSNSNLQQNTINAEEEHSPASQSTTGDSTCLVDLSFLVNIGEKRDILPQSEVHLAAGPGSSSRIRHNLWKIARHTLPTVETPTINEFCKSINRVCWEDTVCSERTGRRRWIRSTQSVSTDRLRKSGRELQYTLKLKQIYLIRSIDTSW